MKATNRPPFPSRRTQLRLYLVLLPALALAAAVGISSLARLVTERLDLRADMTEARLFQLSGQSADLLGALEDDIEIFTLYRTGAESRTILNLLEKMESRFPKIHVSNIDPSRTPLFTAQFDPLGAGVAENSVIVTDALRQRYTVISPAEFFTADVSTGRITGFDAERRIMSAVEYVSSGRRNRVLLARGHGEADDASLSQPVRFLESANYIVEGYNIALAPSPPDPETDLVLIINPRADITESEFDTLSAFLKGGGRLMLCLGAGMESAVFDNLNQLLGSFNFTVADGIVMEDNPSHYLGDRAGIVPLMSRTDLTSALIDNDMAAVFPRSRPLLPVSERLPENVAVTVVLASSRDSFAKTDFESPDRAASDAPGPFAVGLAAVEKLGEDRFSYITAFGSSEWLTDAQAFRNPGNYNLLLTAVEWMFSGRKMAHVTPRPLGENVLEISDNAVRTGISVLVLGILPPGVLLLGCAVLIKRRRSLSFHK